MLRLTSVGVQPVGQAVDGDRQASHAFDDLVVGWQREVETHVESSATRRTIGVERLAGGEDDALASRLGQEVANADAFSEATPEVDAALGPVRGDEVAAVFLQRCQHAVAP